MGKINARVLEVWQKREKEKSRGPETQKHVLEQIRMRAEPKGTVREKYHKVQNANRNWQIKKEVAHKAEVASKAKHEKAAKSKRERKAKEQLKPPAKVSKFKAVQKVSSKA